MAKIKVYFHCVKAYNPPTQRTRWVILKFSASIHYYLYTNKIWITNGNKFEKDLNRNKLVEENIYGREGMVEKVSVFKEVCF